MPTSARQNVLGFTESFGEFATSQWADVGIGPYYCVGMCIRIRQHFLLD